MPDDPKGPQDDQRVREMTQEQLRAWFGLPSFDDLAEKGIVPVEQLTADEQQLKNRNEKLQLIEADMVWRIERHAAAAERHSREMPPRPWEGRVLTFDDAAVQALPGEDDWREVDIPLALTRDLDVNAPQANLRDLHRVEKEFFIQYQSPWDDDFDQVPADPMQPIRDTVRRDYRVGTTITPAQREIDAAIAGLRTLLRAPWPEAKREHARQREAELLGKEASAAAVKSEPGEPS